MTFFRMKRFLGIVGIFLLAACGRQETMVGALGQQALQLASVRCQNAKTLGWLKDIILRAEIDVAYKGSIYIIQYSSGTVFLHQPWVSSCFGCNVYTCEGISPTLSESEKSEIFAGAKEENLIYSSSH